MTIVAQAAAPAKEPWWVISSSAAVLHGADFGDIADVDLLMGPNDASSLLTRLGIVPEAGTASPLFKSAVFGRWRDPPLPVEIMADFHVATTAGWRAVSPASRESVLVDGHMLYIPSTEELIGLFVLFGRPKDLARARLLRSAAR